MSGAWAIIAAAGEGKRLRASRSAGAKGFVELAGVPMLTYSLMAFAKASRIEGVVLVVPGGTEDRARSVADEAVPALRVEIVAGGSSRQASVRAGLDAIPPDVDQVVVHDAARPLVTASLIEIALSALRSAPGVVVAVPEIDTLKREQQGFVNGTIDRSNVWRAQTPQAFRADVLRAAHARAAIEGFEATDDASLLEWTGEPVMIVKNSDENLKVTTSGDLAVAEAILAARRSEGPR